MKTSSFLFYIALLCVVLVLADLFLWFSVVSDTASFEDNRQHYLEFYPTAMQNARLLTVISIMLLTVSGFIFINASKNNIYKTAATVLGLLSAVLLIWKIFSIT